MAARPAPAFIDIVVDHQHPIPGGVHHPRRSGKMGGFILPGEDIRQQQRLPQQRQIPLLLLIAGAVGVQSGLQLVGHGRFLLGRDCAGCGPGRGAAALRAAAAAPAGAAGSGRRPERPAPRCGSCTKYTTGGAKKKAPEGAFSYVQNVDFSRAGWPPGRKS